MKFHGFMCSYEVKKNKNINNLFKQSILMYLSLALCKNTYIEHSRWRVNHKSIY
jgi:hypothetical protein